MSELSMVAAPIERTAGAHAGGRDWIVCQIGAREHYALAAELHRRGRLRALCTDVWAGKWSAWRMIAALAGSQGLKIRQRYETSLNDARVFTMAPLGVMAQMLLERRMSPNGGSWSAVMDANRRFGSAMASRLERSRVLWAKDGAPVVFAYSYAARDVFSLAKRAGGFTVLGQIDPGPDEELIIEVARRHGLRDMGRNDIPAAYWSDWREECALADLILVNSEWSAASLRRAGVAAGKLRVIPLAFRGDAYSTCAARERDYPAAFTADRPLELLFLGRAEIRKGALELVEAMRRLRDAPVRLLMVGRAAETIRAQAEDAPNIEWFGQVARSETAAFYRRADVFVLPTHSDGFAITQLEALAHGLPVIASRNCGDAIEHGRQGLRLDAVSAEDIESAVRFALAHPEELRNMAARASARLALFAPERVVDALIAVVEEARA